MSSQVQPQMIGVIQKASNLALTCKVTRGSEPERYRQGSWLKVIAG
ncbi:hypothetical protein ACRYJJ_13385 [Cylindrospermopsis raciborskii G7]